MVPIILASTSKYRQKLMCDAGFEVECVAPDFEEIRDSGVHPFVQIGEFARGKARSVANHYPESIVIGSDQGLVLGDELLGKPGTVDAACAQLMHLRGKTAGDGTVTSRSAFKILKWLRCLLKIYLTTF